MMSWKNKNVALISFFLRRSQPLRGNNALPFEAWGRFRKPCLYTFKGLYLNEAELNRRRTPFLNALNDLPLFSDLSP